jgi:NTE family protein
LEDNKLLAGHIKEHIMEVSRSKGNATDSGTLAKSIPISGKRDNDLNNISNNHIGTSVYGDEDGNGRKNVVSYNGIDNDILMASCLFPYSSHYTSLYDILTKEKRTFWDGAFLSNTPLREFLQNHKDFWVSYFEANGIDYDNIGVEEYKIYQNDRQDGTVTKPKIPDLEVFIVNLYPALETKNAAIPSDKDKIEDRMNDIRFHDRSKYDEKVAHLVTDYVDLTRRLIKLAEETGKVGKKDIEAALGITGESTKRDVKQKRNLLNLIEDKFRVKVYRIDRQDDNDTILGKASVSHQPL